MAIAALASPACTASRTDPDTTTDATVLRIVDGDTVDVGTAPGSVDS